MQASDWLTAGAYLGHRLQELRVDTAFVVPGDYNLTLCDSLILSGLKLCNLSSELACAYAADGYARSSRGLGVCVTTHLVGALSALNGVAGAYAEEVPLLSIVGVPSTRQYAGMCSLHHTVGNAEDMSQQVDCYRPVTCFQTILRNFTDARYLIDKALTKALSQRKPVLLEVCRDVALVPHASFGLPPPAMAPFAMPRAASDPAALARAAAAAAAFFAGKRLPLIVAGRRVRTCAAALEAFAAATGWGLVNLHDAKGMVNESLPGYLGTYSPIYTSPASIKTCYEAADAILFVGTHFNELAFGAPPDEALERRAVMAYKNRVLVAHTDAHNGVATDDFLAQLASLVTQCDGLVSLFRSLPAAPPPLPEDPQFVPPPAAPLTMAFVCQQLQAQLLDGREPFGLVVDTGDSMLRTQLLKLPPGCPYEIQLFAGNIGWGCPAGLGYSLAVKGERRMLVISGDGGLQMTASEIGNYVRWDSNAIFLCVNNNGYLIERYLSPIIHSDYNYVPAWDYAAVAEAMCRNMKAQGKKCAVFQVRTEAEAVAAITKAKALTDSFCFIEAIVDRGDAAPAAPALRANFLANHFDFPAYSSMPTASMHPAGGSTLTPGGAAVSGPPSRQPELGEVVASVTQRRGSVAGGGPPSSGSDEEGGGLFGLGAPPPPLHHTAGRNSCLAQQAAPAAAEGCGSGGGAGTPGAAAGARSRLGLLPAKRPAEAEPGADGS